MDVRRTAPRPLLGVGMLLALTTLAVRAPGAFDPHPPDFATALVHLAATVLALVVGWAWLLGAAALIEALTGRAALTRWLCPAGWRAPILAALGVASFAAAAPAGATTHPVSGGPPAVLRALDRPLGSTSTSAGTVVVRPGESLWAIAAARLPEDAGAAATGALAAALYRANRDVIGPDPDLIVPGQRLRLPAGLAARRRHQQQEQQQHPTQDQERTPR